MNDENKIALVCKYSVWCNSDKPCDKCQFLNELKIVDLNELEDEGKEMDEGCSCS